MSYNSSFTKQDTSSAQSTRCVGGVAGALKGVPARVKRYGPSTSHTTHVVERVNNKGLLFFLMMMN